jgi:hypothetical protein
MQMEVIRLPFQATTATIHRAPMGREGFLLRRPQGFTLGYYLCLPPGGRTFISNR